MCGVRVEDRELSGGVVATQSVEGDEEGERAGGWRSCRRDGRRTQKRRSPSGRLTDHWRRRTGGRERKATGRQSSAVVLSSLPRMVGRWESSRPPERHLPLPV